MFQKKVSTKPFRLPIVGPKTGNCVNTVFEKKNQLESNRLICSIPVTTNPKIRLYVSCGCLRRWVEKRAYNL